MTDYSQHYRILGLEIYDKKLKFFLILTSAPFLEIFFLLKNYFFFMSIQYTVEDFPMVCMCYIKY